MTGFLIGPPGTPKSFALKKMRKRYRRHWWQVWKPEGPRFTTVPTDWNAIAAEIFGPINLED